MNLQHTSTQLIKNITLHVNTTSTTTPPLILQPSIMKSFQAIIIAAIFAAAAAANEPVASPAAANVERELAEYEKRHLQDQGTPATSPPNAPSPRRVSSLFCFISLSFVTSLPPRRHITCDGRRRHRCVHARSDVSTCCLVADCLTVILTISLSLSIYLIWSIS